MAFFFCWSFCASTPKFETYVRGMFVSGRHIDASNVIESQLGA